MGLQTLYVIYILCAQSFLISNFSVLFSLDFPSLVPGCVPIVGVGAILSCGAGRSALAVHRSLLLGRGTAVDVDTTVTRKRPVLGTLVEVATAQKSLVRKTCLDNEPDNCCLSLTVCWFVPLTSDI